MLKAIVMPPATGKSRFLQTHDCAFVIEADTACHPRKTPSLSFLRDQAKTTGDWSAYDTKLSAMIKSALSPEIRVILLSSHELAAALNAAVVATLTLEYQAWLSSITDRNQHYTKHLQCYNQAVAHSAEILNDAIALDARLYEILKDL